MQPPQEPTHLGRIGAARVALHVTRDEAAVLEADDLRGDAEASGRERGLVLVLAVDAEQCGVLAADAENERLAVEHDLEVAVRDAAAEGLDLGRPARPETFDDLLGAHGRS